MFSFESICIVRLLPELKPFPWFHYSIRVHTESRDHVLLTSRVGAALNEKATGVFKNNGKCQLIPPTAKLIYLQQLHSDHGVSSGSSVSTERFCLPNKCSCESKQM